MKIGRSRLSRVAKGESVDRVTYVIFYARVLIGDRVDSGPRDRSRPRRDPTLATRPRRLQGKTVWEPSPTRKKNIGFPRLNRGAPLSYHSVTVPPMLPGPTIPVGPPLANPPATWRPTRAPTWARPRGLLPRVSATCAPRGPPGLCHVASVPRRTPGRSCAPRQPPPRHVSTYK